MKRKEAKNLKEINKGHKEDLEVDREREKKYYNYTLISKNCNWANRMI